MTVLAITRGESGDPAGATNIHYGANEIAAPRPTGESAPETALKYWIAVQVGDREACVGYSSGRAQTLCSSADRPFGLPAIEEVNLRGNTAEVEVRFRAIDSRYMTVLRQDGYAWRVTAYEDEGDTSKS